MLDLVPLPADYAAWLTALKARIHGSQTIGRSVSESLATFWHTNSSKLSCRYAKSRLALTRCRDFDTSGTCRRVSTPV